MQQFQAFLDIQVTIFSPVSFFNAIFPPLALMCCCSLLAHPLLLRHLNPWTVYFYANFHSLFCNHYCCARLARCYLYFPLSLFIHLSVYLSICLSTYQSICLPINPLNKKQFCSWLIKTKRPDRLLNENAIIETENNYIGE